MESGRITFTLLRRGDLALLQRWLGEPHVARWWVHDPSPEGVEADFGPSVDGLEAGKDFIVHLDGEPIGLMQLSRFADYPDYAAELHAAYPLGNGAATIDYFIGEPHLVGQGLGSAMIESFVEIVHRHEPDITHLVVPVSSANVASWRALLNAGFRTAAQVELDPDNPRDGRAHHVMRRDLVTITRVTPEVVETGLPPIAPDVFDDDPTSASLASFVAHPRQLLVVAIDGSAGVVGQCAGHALADVSGRISLYIDNLGVSPLHQRRRVATRLVSEMLRWATERGCESAWLVAETDNAPAFGLYRSLGGTASAATMFELDVGVTTAGGSGIRGEGW